MATKRKPKLPLPKGGVDIPGPIDWENASHWVEYNHRNLTVSTFCRTGPDRQYKLKTRIRPMVGSELIHSKVRHFTTEEILRAYGFDYKELIKPKPFPKRYNALQRLIKRWFRL